MTHTQPVQCNGRLDLSIGLSQTVTTFNQSHSLDDTGSMASASDRSKYLPAVVSF